MEEFKIIPGLESYCINREGIVKALPKIREGNLACLNNHHGSSKKSQRKYKERVIKPVFRARYWYIGLMHNGIRKNYRVYRLVYLTFIGKIPEGMVIDHIDGNTSNNSVDNLRCVTLSQNRQNPNTAYKNYKKVIQLDKNTEDPIQEFQSITHAMMSLEIPYRKGMSSHIGDVCCGKRETCYGYKWKWGD